MTEEWKDVLDYVGLYQVSNFGNVRSLERFVVGGKGKRQFVSSRLLKQTNDTYGYKVVSLCDSASGRRVIVKKVHRLVLCAFYGVSEMMVCHNDGDAANNQLINLRYGTAKDNANDRSRHGKVVGAKGEKNGMSKINKEIVEKIRIEIGFGKSCQKISLMFGLCAETIRKIKLGRNWSHI